MANLVVANLVVGHGSGGLLGNHRVFQYHRKVWAWKIFNPQHRALSSAIIDVMDKQKSFLGLFWTFWKVN